MQKRCTNCSQWTRHKSTMVGDCTKIGCFAGIDKGVNVIDGADRELPIASRIRTFEYFCCNYWKKQSGGAVVIREHIAGCHYTLVVEGYVSPVIDSLYRAEEWKDFLEALLPLMKACQQKM